MFYSIMTEEKEYLVNIKNVVCFEIDKDEDAVVIVHFLNNSTMTISLEEFEKLQRELP